MSSFCRFSVVYYFVQLMISCFRLSLSVTRLIIIFGLMSKNNKILKYIVILLLIAISKPLYLTTIDGLRMLYFLVSLTCKCKIALTTKSDFYSLIVSGD